MKKILTLLMAATFASATALAATPKAAEDFNGAVDSTAAPVPKVKKAHQAKAKHAKAKHHAKAKKMAYKKPGKKKKSRTHRHH